MCFLVGLSVGAICFFFNWGIASLSSVKFTATKAFITPGGGLVVPWLVFIAFATLYGAVAGVCGSFISPRAAGR